MVFIVGLINSMKLRSCSKGEIAQLKVQLMAANKNYLCSLPTNGESSYDILLDDGKNNYLLCTA